MRKIYHFFQKISRVFKEEGIEGIYNRFINILQSSYSKIIIYKSIKKTVLRSLREAHYEQSKILAQSSGYVYESCIKGDIAEFGTDAAFTSVALATSVNLLNKKNRYSPKGTKRLHFFDSFKGFPEPESNVDQNAPLIVNSIWQKGGCFTFHSKEFKKKIEIYINKRYFTIYEGWFKDTLHSIKKDQKFALIHIDCCYYSSAIEVLETLFRQKTISKGAIILFKDFHGNEGNSNFGEQKAFKEVCEKYNIKYTDLGSYGFASSRFLINDYHN